MTTELDIGRVFDVAKGLLYTEVPEVEAAQDALAGLDRRRLPAEANPGGASYFTFPRSEMGAEGSPYEAALQSAEKLGIESMQVHNGQSAMLLFKGPENDKLTNAIEASQIRTFERMDLSAEAAPEAATPVTPKTAAPTAP
ncbi:MAG: hypothetical protein WC989_00430 [Micavibrio sp.]